MCRINIIHFSHHFAHTDHDVFFRPEEAPNSFSSSSSSSTITTTCNNNNCHLFNPATTIAAKLNFLPRLTEEEEFMSLQRLPQHQFVPCPTHTNHYCVVYKQSMPCLLQRFHSTATAAAAAEVNANDNANSVDGSVNVATCPNLEITKEYHPLSLILEDINNNNNENGESMPVGGSGVHTTTITLSQAKTAVLSSADEIHQQTIVMDKHLLETCELLERLYRELALHTTHTHTHTHTQPTTTALQRAQSRAFFMELENPLQRASELCQQINQADKKISELFRLFLQRRKDMSDLLHMAVEKKKKKKKKDAALQKEEVTDCGAYPISKAEQDLRELTVSNIREVCEGSLRRGREVSAELVRLLEAVSKFMQAV